MKKLLTLCAAMLFLLCAYFAPSSSCYAAERLYGITETELATLEARLMQQDRNNKALLQDSKELRARLNSSTETCKELEKRLHELTVQSQTQETRLETANKLLQEYEKEARLKRLRIKRQRNFYFCLAAGLGAWALSK